MSAPAIPPDETTTLPVSDPEPPVEETESVDLPTEEDRGDAAAPSPDETAAAMQVDAPVEETRPQYLTREEWEQEKAEVARRAAAEALEAERRRRQAENARKSAAAQREAEEQAEAVDLVRAAFGARGVYDIPDDAVITAIDRVARRRAQSLAAAQAEAVEAAFDYIVAPVTGADVELDESLVPIGQRLAPKVQALINQLVPQIEASARKDYIHKDEVPKLVEAEVARRAAQARRGTEELPRAQGTPGKPLTFEALEAKYAAGEASPDEEARYLELRSQGNFYRL